MTLPSDNAECRSPNEVEYNGCGSNNLEEENTTNLKLVVSNVPENVELEKLQSLMSIYEGAQKYEKIGDKDGQTQTFLITFETPEQVKKVISEVNNKEFEGNKLRVIAYSEKHRNNRHREDSRNIKRNIPNTCVGSRTAEFPLRMLVPSEMVGAIIGRQGTTIKTITQQSRARVDVHRKENIGSVEKSITIFGNPDNCTQACKKILEVIQQETSNTTKVLETTLKILAHNNLIGRIIGKEGNTIKRIMQDTETKIAVSSESVCTVNEISSFNVERIITVKGTIDNVSKAESLISTKLRQSFESDLQSMIPSTVMFPGLSPVTMLSANSGNVGYMPRGEGPSNYQPSLYGAPPYLPMYHTSLPVTTYGTTAEQDYQETVYLYIPNSAVGAIIGTKGSHIRTMIRYSNASIKIAAVKNEKPDENNRKVTIVGTPEAQWKAQYMIFEKMREEGFSNGPDDVRLIVELLVPNSEVGRIIGRGGQNVRELQRATRATINVSDVCNAANSNNEETSVHIFGTFIAVQSAQRQIRSMLPPVSLRQLKVHGTSASEQ